jgi:transcriptional regulator with XRE-family HTH domain
MLAPQLAPEDSSYEINGDRLRKLREALGWSQITMAKKAGYSERLVRKAESGGSLRVQTIRHIAEAFSANYVPVKWTDLIKDSQNVSRRFIEAYDAFGPQSVECCKELFSPNFCLNVGSQCGKHPVGEHLNGRWLGIAGLKDYFLKFFSSYSRQACTLEPTYYPGQDSTVVVYTETLVKDGVLLPPTLVQIRIRIYAGLIVEMNQLFIPL